MEEINEISFWKKYKWWFLIPLFLIIVFLIFVFFVMQNRGFRNKVTQEIKYGALSNLESCGKEQILFTQTPVKLEDFQGLVPLGNMDPPSHVFPTDHIYFHPYYNEEADMPNEVDIYAPGDMWILKIASNQNSIDGEILHTDYTVDFAPCSEVTGYFIHLTTLSDKLMQAFEENKKDCNSNFSTGGRDYKTCESSVQVEVTTGERIATAGGLKQQGAFDLGLLDYRIEPLKHVNEDRWNSEKHRYTVCPIDYFSSPIKEDIMARFSSTSGDIEVEGDSPCGRIDHDVTGAAQGGWFTKGTKGFSPEDPHLALAPHNIEVKKQTFSVGSSIEGVESDTYLFDPKDSGEIDLNFSKVKSGKTYCYDVFEREYINRPYDYTDKPFTFLIEMPDEEHLNIEKGKPTTCGSGPWEMSSNKVEFER